MEKGKRTSPVTRGQATLFGFKKAQVQQQPASNGGNSGLNGRSLPVQPSLPSVQASIVTQETIEPLVITPVQPRQGTPKLPRAKKDIGKSANRFGFRPPTSMSNKVADIQQSDSRSDTDIRQSLRPQSVPAYKLTKARSASETRYNKFGNGTTINGNTNEYKSSTQIQQQRPAKYAIQTSQLPQPQNVFYSSLNGCSSTSTSTGTLATAGATFNGLISHINDDPMNDKSAKTKANNQKVAFSKQRLQQSSSVSSPSTSSLSDSGMGLLKTKNNDSILKIQQLDHSPTLGAKFRNLRQQKSRPMEMVFTDSNPKRFELRCVDQDQIHPIAAVSNSINESGNSLISGSCDTLMTAQSTLSNAIQQQSFETNSNVNCLQLRATSSCSGDEGFDEVSNSEEKQSRDKLLSEKIRLGHNPFDGDKGHIGLEMNDSESMNDEETMWGRGEAMALDDQMPCANLTDIDQSPESMAPRLRSVLLTIEDQEFTSLAVMAQSTTMLEDEESPDLSCSSPTSVEPLPPPPNLAETPGSPGTPTQATNSLSSDAKDGDFLIDDEIADQPGLIFDTEERHKLRNDSLNMNRNDGHSDSLDIISALDLKENYIADTSRTITKLAGEVSNALASINSGPGSLHSNARNKQQCGSETSLNTLSPCESLASDDLITDFDISDINTPFNDLNEIDDTMKTEILNQSDQVLKEWNSLITSYPR